MADTKPSENTIVDRPATHADCAREYKAGAPVREAAAKKESIRRK